jgi:hypothetical protein
MDFPGVRRGLHKDRANGLVCDAFDRLADGGEAVILDTRHLNTCGRLLTAYPQCKITIVERCPQEYSFIRRRVRRLHAEDRQRVQVIRGDVLEYLGSGAKADCVWLDLMCASVREPEVTAKAVQAMGVMCCAITLAGRCNTRGGITYARRNMQNRNAFEQVGMYQVVDYGYRMQGETGEHGQPMGLAIFDTRGLNEKCLYGVRSMTPTHDGEVELQIRMYSTPVRVPAAEVVGNEVRLWRPEPKRGGPPRWWENMRV